jgi:predicted dehydrogenase
VSKDQKEFRMGLVGCGRISQAYLDAIALAEGVRLTAVMDMRADAARAAAETAGARAFSSVEEFASESGVDGAIICTPPIAHTETACTLMQSGIPVLCEKPFATTLEDAHTMVRAADAADLVLMMASKFRYVEDVIRAKAIVASGMLGDVEFYTNTFCGKVDMRQRWNSDPNVAGGGVLIDNGTHSVDIARYLLGPVARVSAHAGRSDAGLSVEDSVNLSFITETEVMGGIQLSWNVHQARNEYIEISGTEGALRIGWQESAYQNNGHPQWVKFGLGYDKVAAFVNQVSNFVGTVRGNAEPLITAVDGVSSVVVVEAAYRSMETGNWVKVEDQSSSPATSASK